MDVNKMIEAVVETQGEFAGRLRAALRLGARLALEAVLSKGPYNGDVKEVLAELDGKAEALTPVAVPPVGGPDF